MSAKRWIVWTLALAFASGSLGCEAPPESGTPRRVFHFSGLEKLPGEAYESDVGLRGKAATRKVPLRNIAWTYHPTYHEYGESVYHPDYGPTDVRGYDYSEFYEPSPFFFERSDDETLPDGGLLLNFDVRASHVQVPADGGSVWVRTKISAPHFVNRREAGLNLVLILDLSESMRDPEKLKLLQATAGNLVRQLLPTDRISLVAFNGRAHVLVETREADDHGALLDALEGLQAGRGANLGAGLFEAYRQAQEAADTEGGPGNLILLSDGGFGGIDSAIWRSVDLARQRHTKGHRLSCIGLGKKAEPRLLASLAKAGEGRLALIREPKEVGDVLAREMGSTLRAFARNVRMRIVSDEARILAVYGDGFQGDVKGARELVLSDFASGEERSLLLRVKVPAMPFYATHDVRLQLFFKQMSPVRRTILEQSLKFRAAKDAGGVDRSVEAFAHVVVGLDQIRRILEGEPELYLKNVLALLEKDFPRYKAVALAQGEDELVKKVRLFEDFAIRLRTLEQLDKIGYGEEWDELRREFYYRDR